MSREGRAQVFLYAVNRKSAGISPSSEHEESRDSYIQYSKHDESRYFSTSEQDESSYFSKCSEQD
jgi:hypothetical protein